MHLSRCVLDSVSLGRLHPTWLPQSFRRFTLGLLLSCSGSRRRHSGGSRNGAEGARDAMVRELRVDRGMRKYARKRVAAETACFLKSFRVF